MPYEVRAASDITNWINDRCKELGGETVLSGVVMRPGDASAARGDCNWEIGGIYGRETAEFHKAVGEAKARFNLPALDD